MPATMRRDKFVAELEHRNVSPAAIEWCRSTGGSAASLWAKCPDAEWLFEVAGHAGVSRNQLVAAACDCVKLVLPTYERAHPEDLRPRRCIEKADAWTQGKASLQSVVAARKVADWVAYEEKLGPAGSVATAAAYTGNAASNRPFGGSVHLLNTVYCVCAAARHALGAAASDVERPALQLKLARAVRRRIPARDVLAALAMPVME